MLKANSRLAPRLHLQRDFHATRIHIPEEPWVGDTWRDLHCPAGIGSEVCSSGWDKTPQGWGTSHPALRDSAQLKEQGGKLRE